MNEQLGAIIDGAGRSPEDLARAVNRRLAAVRRPPVHRTTPYKWIEGAKPRGIIPALVADVLSEWTGTRITPADLGWIPRQGSPLQSIINPTESWGASTALRVLKAELGDDMDRKLFLAQSGFTLASIANPWLLDPYDRVVDSAGGRRINDATVADIQLITAARRRMDDAMGGGALLSALREDMRVVTHLLSHASYTAEVGRKLFAAAAEQARLASWLCFDTGQYGLAQRYTSIALRTAHASEDRQVGANVLGFSAYQAGVQGDGVAAEAFARTALTSASRGGLTPAVEGSIHARLGLARARLRDLPGAAEAFDNAEALLSESIPEEEPDWIYWFTPGDLHGIAGQSYMFAHEPGTAVSHLEAAITGTDASLTRDKALWLSTAATAQVLNNSPEQGRETAEEALQILSGDLDSGRVADVFTEFCEALRGVDSRAASNFSQRLAEVVPSHAGL